MASNNPPKEYRDHKSSDPFPDIAPSLLNSADIEDYARVVKIIEPFDKSNLKSASYKVPFSGEVHVWNRQEHGEPFHKEIIRIPEDQKYFDLGQNSIAFVFLATRFNLPDYLALRFNLNIKHVHRGLLVGTGPLVDPGFHGRLLIPLHNLTNTPYRLKHDQGLIWAEFTKLSTNAKWRKSLQNVVEQTGKYVEFSSDKTEKEPRDYFDKANLGNPIVSSIPEAVAQSKVDAKNAKEDAKDAKASVRRAERWVWGLSIAGVFALVAIVVSVYGLVTDAVSYVKGSRESAMSAASDVISKNRVLERLESLEADLRTVQESSKSKTDVQKIPPKPNR